ncbi:hypothetical protein ACNKHR_00550 [Shigella flexneri]
MENAMNYSVGFPRAKYAGIN